MKNAPNNRGDPLKKSKKFLFQKSKSTHISSINLRGKVSDTKNIVTSLVYFCNNPYGTPICTLHIYGLNILQKYAKNVSELIIISNVSLFIIIILPNNQPHYMNYQQVCNRNIFCKHDDVFCIIGKKMFCCKNQFPLRLYIL